MIAVIEIGTEVSYDECFRGNRWTKQGTVVEIGTGKNLGRIRVLWSKWAWVNADGTTGERVDGKRTWVAIKRVR